MKVKEFIGVVLIGITLGICFTIWCQAMYRQAEELENEQLSQSELDISQKQLKKITTTSRKKKRR